MRDCASSAPPDNLFQEFNLLTPNNTIYKLIGTALVKQDPVEAKANVRKRLEFIGNEMCVLRAHA